MTQQECPLPEIKCKPNSHPFCSDGRGGAFCCKANQIIICNERPWVSCKEVAYELAHALNVCRDVKCHGGGMEIDGEDCGYLDSEGVSCSEMRASFATACCKLAANEAEMWDCMHYHAKSCLAKTTLICIVVW